MILKFTGRVEKILTGSISAPSAPGYATDIKDIQVKFFSVGLNVEKSLKCILTKFELSTSCRFQDIAVQS